MRELTPLFASTVLHLGLALAAFTIPQYFKWNEAEQEKNKQVYNMELLPSKVNKVVPLKKQPKLPPKKRIVKKAKPKVPKAKKRMAAKKKKLITQKKSPIKVVQSRSQKAKRGGKGAKPKLRGKIPPTQFKPVAKGPKGSSNPNFPEDGRLLRQAAGNIPPKYPVRDRLSRRTGVVTVVGYVDPKGKVSKVRVGQSSGTPSMEDNALRAFSQYRFQKGQEGWVKMPYKFVIGGQTKVLSVRDSRRYDTN